MSAKAMNDIAGADVIFANANAITLDFIQPDADTVAE